ncbi:MULTISPECIES: hypothetical protein [unclassified Pannonibacter]|uniref:hypothetical protein n=1 Tax=unclassified Pannonibacter TaxID=2627228 RepID=UPI0013A5357E|nr:MULTISPECIES: hypothetical protein [unclassified Pannonibacter]
MNDDQGAAMSRCFCRPQTAGKRVARRAFWLLAAAAALAASPAAAGGVKYWVSEHFNEAPDVNYYEQNKDERHKQWHVPIFAPQVLDLSHLDWSKDEDEGADIRLCFDNRPLISANNGRIAKDSVWTGYCSHYSQPQTLKVEDTENRPYYGLEVRRSPDGKFTCEAVFTVRSLISLLAATAEGADLSSPLPPRVLAYRRDSFPFLWKAEYQYYLNSQDTIEIHSGMGGSHGYGRIYLNNTWQCLLPAYRLYWSEALSSCNRLVEEMQAAPDKTELYDPLVTRLGPDMIRLAEPCRQ